MIRILIKIWPSLTPIALLLLWYFIKYQRVKKNPDIENPKLKDEPWQITIIVAVAIAIVCLFSSVLFQESIKGDYVPATLESGILQDGHIE